MSLFAFLIILGLFALVLALQLGGALGRRRAAPAALLVLAVPVGGWLLLERAGRVDPDAVADRTRFASVTSDACYKCHLDYYESWRRTYHRTMTREATPEFVKGDFADAVYRYHGTTTRMTRDGNKFFMETVERKWANRA